MSNLSPEEQLQNQFEGQPWYHSVGRDQYNRLVVYINYSCHEVLHDVPDRVNNIQVLTHFAGSKLVTASQFINSNIPKLEVALSTPESVEDLDADDFNMNLDDLCYELANLEKKCGANCLMDIFFEIHDGKNAVTNNGTRFPEVRDAMQKLLDEYGFDVIYNELEG